MNKNAIHIRVYGRVQGVGFRAFVKARADERGILGWVRNLPDGSVQVFAILPEEDSIPWVDTVRKGPAGAVVESVQVWKASPEESGETGSDIQGFRIERAER